MRVFIGAFKAIGLALVILLTAAPFCFGQATTATLTGIVTDAAGLVVPNANLTLTNELSGDVRKTQTNNEGYYSIVALPPATYSLVLEVPGFQKFSQKGIVLSSAEKRNVDASLQVGLTTQTVEVRSATENITPVGSGEKAEVLNTQTLQSIATVGRSAA